MFLVSYSRRCLRFQGSSDGEGSPKHLCLLIQPLRNRLLHKSLQSLLWECLHSLYFPVHQFSILKTCLKEAWWVFFIGSISKGLILVRSNFHRNTMNGDIRCHYPLWRPVRMLLAFDCALIFISVKDDDDSATVAVVCKWKLEALIEDVAICTG